MRIFPLPLPPGLRAGTVRAPGGFGRPVRRRNSESITEESRGPQTGSRIGGASRQARGSRSALAMWLLAPEQASARPH
jgi:hypothetical protein